MDADGDSPPLWSQLTTTTFFYPHRRPRQPSPIFNPVVLILAVPILVLVVLFLLVPPFLSHITQILHLNSVKKSWDSLIIFLVMFSILCGVFARIYDEVPSDAADQQNLNVIQVSDVARPPPRESVSSSQWYGFSDGKEYVGNVLITAERVGNGSGTPSKSPAPPTPPPPPPPAAKSRRSSRSVPKKEIFEKQRNDDKLNENRSPPPPQPLQRPVAESQFPELKSEIGHRKRSDPVKEIATAIASSLYSKSQRKKVATRNIYDATSASENSSPGQSGAAAASPSPPPPSKVLQKMFKKSSKNKRVHSVSNTAPPPPPPPPPPNSIFNNIFKTGSKSKPFQSSSTTALPPPPPSSILNTLSKTGTKTRRFKNKSTTSPSPSPPPAPTSPDTRRYHTVNARNPAKPNKTGSYYNESVIIAPAPPSPFIPMPPPPPPFRLKEMKFVAREEFVKMRQSSQCSSPPPEHEDSDLMSIKSEGGDSIGPSVSCPSPDVNAKADNFIARRRYEWRLDKMNSMKERGKLG